MSAILKTSEGETILTCVNNEWKGETSNITDNNGNVLNLDKRKAYCLFLNRFNFYLFLHNNTKVPKFAPVT